MSEVIRIKWRDRYGEFLKDPVKVYKKKIQHSVRMIKRYRELIRMHEEKIKLYNHLIELVESGKLKKPENLEEASEKYISGIKRFLGLKEVK